MVVLTVGDLSESFVQQMWGRFPTCAPIVNRRGFYLRMKRRIENPPQAASLPHFAVGITGTVH